jgi:hypothetical protein
MQISSPGRCVDSSARKENFLDFQQPFTYVIPTPPE